MIQRIQSVYFLLAGILPAFTFCVPMAQYLNEQGQTELVLTSWSLSSAEAAVAHPWGILTFTVLSMIMAFVCLFGYKNRRRQIAMSSFLLTLILILGLTFVAYGYSFGSTHALRFLPDWGVLFPSIAFIFAILGRNGVRKDEELVRAADRIR